MSIANWLRYALRSRHRFDPTVGAERIPAVTVRRATMHDLDACRELYELNAPGRFPAGYLEEFSRSFASPETLYLIIERDGRLVATGGIARPHQMPAGCSLLYGLVHPEHHRQGLGTTLLLARLSALGPPPGVWWVFLSSAGDSASFYERFGFRHYGRYPLPPRDELFDCYRSYLRRSDLEACRELLAARGVRFDRTGIEVPTGSAA